MALRLVLTLTTFEPVQERAMKTYTAEDILNATESRTDWKRVDSLTDEEIEQAVAEDPNAELLGDGWFKRAEWIVPEND